MITYQSHAYDKKRRSLKDGHNTEKNYELLGKKLFSESVVRFQYINSLEINLRIV